MLHDSASMLFSSLHLGSLERHIFFIFGVLEGLVLSSVLKHLLRVLIPDGFHLLPLGLRQCSDLPLKVLLHLFLSSKPMLVSASGLELSVVVFVV